MTAIASRRRARTTPLERHAYPNSLNSDGQRAMSIGRLTGSRSVATVLTCVGAVCAGALVTTHSTPTLVFLPAALMAMAGVVAWRMTKTRTGTREAPVGTNILTPKADWWLHPGALAIVAAVVPIGFAWHSAGGSFQSNWHVAKTLSTGDLVLTLALAGRFVTGAFVGAVDLHRVTSMQSYFEITIRQQVSLRKAALVLFWLTLAGYGAWLVIAVLRGLTTSELGFAASHAADGSALIAVKHAYLAPVAGVTTLTQFAPACAAALVLLHRSGARVKWYLAVLLSVALLRTVLNSERLAILEVAIPVAVLLLVVQSPLKRRFHSVRSLVPLWLPIAFLVFFGSFEYVRSWAGYYKQRTNSGYANFAEKRLEGYYATAINNGPLLLASDDRTLKVPYYSLEWLWNAPGTSTFGAYQALSGDDRSQAWKSELAKEGNPEFNNEGGLASLVFDFGRAGAFLVALLIGAAIGRAYRSMKRGLVEGALMYSLCVLGILEVSRILYWSQGRAVPALAAGVWIAHVLRSNRRSADVYA
jgi:hypothetical protein